MLQAAYVTKRSFAASDSATVAGQVLPAREPSGSNQSDFCSSCLDRHATLVKVSDKGRHVNMCDECFTGIRSRAHRERTTQRYEQMRKHNQEHRTKATRQRKAVLLANADEFLIAVDKYACAICGVEKPQGCTYCGPCRAARANLMRVKSWLRSYKVTGNEKMLINALGLSRRYGIKPEDLKFV